MSAEDYQEQTPIIFDSLPYYDNDLEQYRELKQKVDKELAKESKPPSDLHPNVPPAADLFTVSATSPA